jgi:hypothetical protein
VVGYAAINPRVFGATDFVIRNVGRGAAGNVSYKIVSGGNNITAKNARLLPADVKFAFLPQDEQLSVTMGMGWDLLHNPSLAPFEIEVSYENMAGSIYVKRFRIDVGQFEGLSRLGNPPEEEIAESLKKIARVMEQWPHQRP